MNALVGVLLLSSAAVVEPAGPRTPIAHEGSVTILAGVRTVPQGAFAAGVTDRAKVPFGFDAQFGYQWDDHLAVALDATYGRDRYDLAGFTRLTVDAVTVGFLLLGTTRLARTFSLYCGLGGVHNVTAFKSTGAQEAYSEGSTEAGLLCIGARWALGRRFGVQLEDRYTLAYADSGGQGVVNVGGNLAALGFWISIPPEQAFENH